MSETSPDIRTPHATSDKRTPSKRSPRQPAIPEPTGAGVTPSGRKKPFSAMEAKPKPRYHEVDVEAEGAEEAQTRYEGVESSFKGKVDHPAIIADVIKEMDDFFLTKKPKHEDVFELNFYKLHEDIQQAVMEYQKRIDFLKEKQRKHGLTDEERDLNHNFKQQISHLEKIFAHFSDNPNQAKKDAQGVYDDYVAWRGKTENAMLEGKQEDKTQEAKSDRNAREDMTESLRIIEDTREYDDSELSISLNKGLMEVRDFLSAENPTPEEAKALADKLKKVQYGYEGLLSNVAKAWTEAEKAKEHKRVSYLKGLDNEYSSKHEELRRLLVLMSTSKYSESTKKAIDAMLGAEAEKTEKVLVKHQTIREHVPQEAIDEGLREREKALRKEQRELRKQEDALREKLSLLMLMDEEDLPSRGKAIYGLIDRGIQAEKKTKPQTAKPTGFWEKTKALATSWLDKLVEDRKTHETLPLKSQREAKALAKELIRIQERQATIHDQLMTFKDYKKTTLEEVKEAQTMEADVQATQAEEFEKSFDVEGERAAQEAEKEKSVGPLSVEWTKAKLGSVAAAEWNRVAPIISADKSTGQGIRAEINKMSADLRGLDQEALSDDYRTLGTLEDAVKDEPKYAGCPEAAMYIMLKAFKPLNAEDRKAQEAIDKALSSIDGMLSAEMEIPVTIEEGPLVDREKMGKLAVKFVELINEAIRSGKFSKSKLGRVLGSLRLLNPKDEKGGDYDDVNELAKKMSSFESEWLKSQDLANQLNSAQAEQLAGMPPEQRTKALEQASKVMVRNAVKDISQWLANWEAKTGIKLADLQEPTAPSGVAQPIIGLNMALPAKLEDVEELSSDLLIEDTEAEEAPEITDEEILETAPQAKSPKTGLPIPGGIFHPVKRQKSRDTAVEKSDGISFVEPEAKVILAPEILEDIARAAAGEVLTAEDIISEEPTGKAEEPDTLKAKPPSGMNEPLSEETTQAILEEMSASPVETPKKKRQTLRLELRQLANAEHQLAKAEKQLAGRMGELTAQWTEEARQHIDQKIRNLADKMPARFGVIPEYLNRKDFAKRIDQMVKSEAEHRKKDFIRLNAKMMIQDEYTSRLKAADFVQVMAEFDKASDKELNGHESRLMTELDEMAKDAKRLHDLRIDDVTAASIVQELEEKPDTARDTTPVFEAPASAIEPIIEAGLITRSVYGDIKNLVPSESQIPYEIALIDFLKAVHEESPDIQTKADELRKLNRRFGISNQNVILDLMKLAKSNFEQPKPRKKGGRRKNVG